MAQVKNNFKMDDGDKTAAERHPGMIAPE